MGLAPRACAAFDVGRTGQGFRIVQDEADHARVIHLVNHANLGILFKPNDLK